MRMGELQRSVRLHGAFLEACSALLVPNARLTQLLSIPEHSSDSAWARDALVQIFLISYMCLRFPSCTNSSRYRVLYRLSKPSKNHSLSALALKPLVNEKRASAHAED